MKIRSDFVSNSSSSSFVLWNSSGDVTLFLEKFAEMFANVYMPWEMDSALSVYVNTTYRWFEHVVKALLSEDKAKSEIDEHRKYMHYGSGGASKVNLDDITYDNIHISFSDLAENYDKLLSVADKISSLYIEAQDQCSTSDLD